MVNDSSEVDPEALGKLQFIVDFINDIGINNITSHSKEDVWIATAREIAEYYYENY